MLVDKQASINAGVRAVVNDVELRGLRRKAEISGGLYENVNEYPLPADLNGSAIIGLVPQSEKLSKPFQLVPFENFQRYKDNLTMAIDQSDQTRKLLLSIDLDATSKTLSSLDSTTAGGGTWVGFGDVTDSTIEANADYYIKGAASLEYDINSDAGTTAGIQNTGLDTFDITNYFDGTGRVFLYAWITDSTNITNFTLRIGNDASNYYSLAVTADYAGNALSNGWNLLSFAFNSMTETGTVDLDACDYIAVYMTKDAAKVDEVNYRFDDIVMRRGELYDIKYYSSYPWENASGTRLQNSTDTGDYIVADSDEFELYVEKCVEIIAPETDEHAEAKVARESYIERRSTYLSKTPSEAQLENYEYHRNYVD